MSRLNPNQKGVAMPEPTTQTDQNKQELNNMTATLTDTPKEQGVLTNITEPKEKPTKEKGNGHYSYQKTSAYDRKALQLLKEDPTLSVNQIGTKLVELGKAKSRQHIYNRLTKSDILRAEFARVEKYELEQLHRDIYPLAVKQWKSILKSGAESNKVSLIKLTADKVHGETHKHVVAPTINVANIERMQVIINNDLDNTLSKAADPA